MTWDERPWRVGTHYGIHVYAVVNEDESDDEPILTVVGDPEWAQAVALQVAEEHNHCVDTGWRWPRAARESAGRSEGA